MRPSYPAAVVGLAAFFVAYFARAYPWPLAAIAGATIAAFVYATVATVVRLRSELRLREVGWQVDREDARPVRPGSGGAGRAERPPGKGDQRGQEQPVDEPAGGETGEQ